KEDSSENKSKKDDTIVDEIEESKKEFDCRKCGEGFKDFKGVIADVYKEAKQFPLDMYNSFNLLEEKQLCEREPENSPDENITGNSSRSRNSSVSSHKLQSSRKSFPAAIPINPERKLIKIFYDEYPTHVTPLQSLPYSQTLKEDSLSVKDSTAENILQPYKRSCCETGYASSQSECSKEDSVQSLTLETPKQRYSSSPELFREEPSRSVCRSKASHNLKSLRRSCTTTTERPGIEMVGRVFAKYPNYGTYLRTNPSSQALKEDSLIVKDSTAKNLLHYEIFCRAFWYRSLQSE
ncbi:hypothetical protein TNCT_310631, partial [Trichonephila clavata]